jgi:hypothetical protein
MQNLSFRRNLFVDSENYFRRRFISSSEADGRFSFFLTHVANCSKWSSCWCRRKLSTTRIPSTT